MADNEMRIKIKVDQTEFNKAMRDMNKAQSDMAQKSSSYNKQASSSDYGAGAIGNATKGLGGMMKGWVSASTGLGTFTAAMSPLTLGLSLLGKGIGAATGFVKDSIKQYSEFEGTLKQVQVISGGTKEDMDLLGQTAIEVGGNTSKGAQEMADAMVDFAKLGFTATETASAMTGIVYAAEASGSAVDTTARIVATALNTWNLEASEAERVADVLAKTSNETAADMTDLGYTLQYAAASGSLAGASLEDMAAMTGIMADNGIRGSKAGTTLRTAFTNLLNPTNAAAEAMEGLGVQWRDAEGNARPTMEVINDLQDATKGLSDLEVADLSTKLFGKTGSAGMSFVLKTTVGELDNLTTALENSTGTAARQAYEMRQTISGQLDELGDSVDAIKLKWVKAFEEMGGQDSGLIFNTLKGINGILNDVTTGVDEFFKNYKKTDDLLNRSGGLVKSYQDARRFGDAFADLENDMRNFQTDPLERFFKGIQNGTRTSMGLFAELNEAAKNIKYIDDDQLNTYMTANTKISNAVGTMMAETNVAYATMRSSGKSVADMQGTIAQAVQKGTSQVGTALAEQMEIYKTAETNRLASITTTLMKSESLDSESKQRILMNEAEWGQIRVQGQQKNAEEILNLTKGMANMTFEEQAAAQERIQVLTEENNGRLIDTAKIQNEAELEILRTQSQELGGITKQQKLDAVSAANEQYTETTSLAMQEYLERRASIEAMASSSEGISENMKEKLLKDARDQMTGTTTSAAKMRDRTVEEINGMDERASELNGAEIVITESLPTIADTMGQLGELAAKINKVIEQINGFIGKAQQASEAMSSFTGAKHAFNADNGGLVGWIGQKTGLYNFNPGKKAKGGIGDLGGGYGATTGSKTFGNATVASASSNQLGQRGVKVGEAGREIIMPTGNSTYMTPFAKAVAADLAEMQGTSQSGTEMVAVNVILDGRTVAKALAKPLKDVQGREATITNRGRGV